MTARRVLRDLAEAGAALKLTEKGWCSSVEGQAAVRRFIDTLNLAREFLRRTEGTQ